MKAEMKTEMKAAVKVGGKARKARKATKAGRSTKEPPRPDANPFTLEVKRVLRSIPRGRVASYGQVATLAGNPGAARQVVRVLHSSSARDCVPWHRVIRSNGEIALPRMHGYEEQRARLAAEGVEFGFHDRIDLERFGWRPRGRAVRQPRGEVQGSKRRRAADAKPKKLQGAGGSKQGRTADGNRRRLKLGRPAGRPASGPAAGAR